MVRVDLKGIAKARAKGRTYYYAWRGGPRLRGEPGSPEFVASYNEAIENLRTPDASRFRFIITDYKASGDYKKLAASTRDQWGKWHLTLPTTLASCASRNLIGRKKSAL